MPRPLPTLRPHIVALLLLLLLSLRASAAEEPGGGTIRTPRPSESPRINGPKVYGVRPGRPFLFRIPATGRRPMRFSAIGLPQGLGLDPQSGIISGRIRDAEKRTYHTVLVAENNLGKAQRELRIVVGDTLALTPPMGWNSWYIYADRVTQENMRDAAEAMIRSGMTDCGYQYISIDDGWMKRRGEPPYCDAGGALLPNAKFPDLSGLCELIHSKGLKAGIYSSPGDWTCGGYAGSYGHEAADMSKFAEWGFDLLKYDLCGYKYILKNRDSPDELKKPYKLAHDLLQKQDRDIVLNLCEYGMANVWQWGGEVGQCWRTTGDLGAVKARRLPGFYEIGLSNAQHDRYAKPGQWNDPDYLLLGWTGDAETMTKIVPTALTPDEQYSYMSMWCLMAAPLFFSGDMTRLDPFTLGVLCNPEVIDVDQDPLGRQAKIVARTAQTLILAKPLEDGSLAVGLLNLSGTSQTVAVDWKPLGVTGPQVARDLWRQKDLGICQRQFAAPVGPHGVCLIRLWPKGNDHGPTQ